MGDCEQLQHQQRGPTMGGAREKLIELLLKTVMHMVPILPLLTIVMTFTWPISGSERIFVDEHAWPVQTMVSLAHSGHFSNRAAPSDTSSSSNNVNKGTVTHVAFHPISPCFDAAWWVSDSVPGALASDGDPTVVVFTSASPASASAEAIHAFVSSANNTVVMPAPVVVLRVRAAVTQQRCLSQIAEHIDLLPFGGGNVRAVAIVDEPSAAPDVGDVEEQHACFDIRFGGEGLLPNLDATNVLTGFRSFPPCTPVSFAVRGGALAPVRDFILLPLLSLSPQITQFVASVFSLPSPSLFEAFLAQQLHRVESHFGSVMSDLLSSAAQLRREIADDPVVQSARALRLRTGAPVVRLRIPYSSSSSSSSSSALRQRVVSYVTHYLFPAVYSFTFLQERLHHSQVGYLLSLSDSHRDHHAARFTSVNVLQIAVFVAISCIGVQFMRQAAVVTQVLELTRAREGSSTRKVIFALFLCAVGALASGAFLVYASDQIDGRAFVLAGLGINLLIKLLSMLEIAFLDRSPRHDDDDVGGGDSLPRPALGGCVWVMCVTIVQGGLLAMLLTINFSLALCACVPVAFAQSFAFSGAELSRLLFAEGDDAGSETSSASTKRSSASDRVKGVAWGICRMIALAFAVVSGAVMLHPVLGVPLADEASSWIVGPMLLATMVKLF